MIKQTRTGPGKFIIGESSDLETFDSQVRSITLEPEVDKGEPKEVLSGEIMRGERTEKFKITGTLINDFGAQDSLVEFCWAKRGQELPFTFTPNTSTGREITGDLIVEAVSIGGEVGETPETDFEFDVVGTPVIGDTPGSD